MKKLSLLIVLALCIQSNLSAQFGVSCLPDGILFRFQSQIDNFQTNYPNCTKIEGNVHIGWPTYSINNLDGLSVLTSIGGNLSIGNGYWSSSNLINLTGLDNLNSIGGNLSIDGNQGLERLTGIENLSSVGGGISINSNPSLTSIKGLKNIDTINDLYITNNVSLSSCEEEWLCDFLSNPTGSVNIYNNASGCNNPPEVANACGITLSCLPFGIYYFSTQADIDDFSVNYPNCNELVGDITISGYDITNLNGLNVVTSIGGDLLIVHNETLINVTGLGNLITIGGTLSIGSWDYMHEEIFGNPSLSSLTGLDNVISIGGDLNILGNDSLSICEVQSICNYLENPNGEIEIMGNAPGCDSRDEVELACTVSVDEVHLSDKILIYPNPSSTQITIELPNAPQKNATLTIYNMNAQQMLTSKKTGQKTVIDISGLPKGIYFVKVADDRTVMVGKMVKK